VKRIPPKRFHAEINGRAVDGEHFLVRWIQLESILNFLLGLRVLLLGPQFSQLPNLLLLCFLQCLIQLVLLGHIYILLFLPGI
jgi:hypothetical protein